MIILLAVILLSAIALKRKGGINASSKNPPPPAQMTKIGDAKQVDPNAEGVYYSPPGPAPLSPVEVYRYTDTLSPGISPFSYDKLQSGTGAGYVVREV